MCIKMLQNNVIHCLPSILRNTILQKKEEIDKNYDPSNLFLTGFKSDQRYKIHKEESISLPEETIAERVKLRRKNPMMKIYLTCHHQKVMKKQKEKESKF